MLFPVSGGILTIEGMTSGNVLLESYETGSWETIATYTADQSIQPTVAPGTLVRISWDTVVGTPSISLLPASDNGFATAAADIVNIEADIVAIESDITAIDTILDSTCRTIFRDNTQVSITENTTAERIVAIIPITAGSMGATGSLYGHVLTSQTASTSTKNIRVYLGDATGAVGGAITLNTSTAFVTVGISSNVASSGFSFMVGNRTAATNVGGLFGSRGTGQSLSVVTGTINTALAQKLIITIEKASAGTDTISLESLKIERATS
jgi:hypothetical protein